MRNPFKRSAAACVAALVVVGLSAGCTSQAKKEASPAPEAVLAPVTASPAAKTFCVAQLNGDGRLGQQIVEEAKKAGAGSVTVHDLIAEATPEGALAKAKSEGCGLVVSPWPQLGEAAVKAAKDNPNIVYAAAATVGDSLMAQKVMANFKPLTIRLDEGGFMAGYVAAGTTRSGVVATFTSAPSQLGSIWGRGVAQGVDYYNRVKGTGIKLHGWENHHMQLASIPEPAGIAKWVGEAVANKADVFIPLAGAAAMQTFAGLDAAGTDANVIWVGTDAYDTIPTQRGRVLTSVLVNPRALAEPLVNALAKGEVDNSPLELSWKNGGVSLADFREQAVRLIPALQSELQDLAKQMREGKLEVGR